MEMEMEMEMSTPISMAEQARIDAIKECISLIEESHHDNRPILNPDIIEFKFSSMMSIAKGQTSAGSNGEEGKDSDGDGGGGGTCTRSIDDANMIGVFAKQDIQKDQILLKIPPGAVLSSSKSSMEKENVPTIQLLMKRTMNKYDDLVDETFENMKEKEYDFYRFEYGRTVSNMEVRLTFFLTMLLCYIEMKTSCEPKYEYNIGSKLKEELERMVCKWSPYLNTWPTDPATSLPPFWSRAEDLDNIQGTAFSRFIARVRNEYIENWNEVFRPSLEKAGIYIYKQRDTKNSHEEICTSTLQIQSRLDGLPMFYQRAIAAVQSRTHGSMQDQDGETDMLGRLLNGDGRDIVLFPLADLVNGERSIECINVEFDGNDSGDGILRALRDIKAGQELIVSYFEATSFSYLQRFGFLPMHDGLPDLNNEMLALSLPEKFAPDSRDTLRWKKLWEDAQIVKENISTELYGAGPFCLFYNNEMISSYRKNPDGPTGAFPAQLAKLHQCAIVLLCNDKALRDIPQEGFLENYESGRKMVQIIDHWLDQFATPSNEYDLNLIEIERQSGNLLMGTYIRMVEREILTKWRHAICIRHGCYGYGCEYAEVNVRHVPPLDSRCCVICKATFHVKKCARCKAVHYCSVKCQIEHWRMGHKAVCKNNKLS